VTDGPGEIHQIVHGGEDYHAQKRDVVKKGNAYATRMVYTFFIPAKDLAEAPETKQGLKAILKAHPELATIHFRQLLAKQFALGAGTDGTQGFVTLNGGATYSPQGTARTGILDAAAPSAQTSTGFGLAKQGAAAGVAGWYNEFGTCSTFSGDGLRELRLVYQRARRNGVSINASVDCMISDDLSFANYLELKGEEVMVMDTLKGESGVEDDREGLKFLNATWYPDENYDNAAALVSGTNGRVVGLATGAWHIFTLGSDSQKETNGDFAMRGPYKHPTKDGWNYEIVVDMGMYTNMLSTNFLFTGGAVL